MDRRFWWVVLCAAGLVLVSHAVLIAYAGPQIPSSDGITYYLKAREVVNGDWVPIRSHEIGWPILMSLPLLVVGSSSVAVKMQVLAAYNGFWAALSIIPVAYLARQWFGRVWSIALAVWVCVLLRNTYLITGLLTEPSFAVTVLVALVAISRPLTWRSALAAGVFAGLSTWIRPNGVFVFAGALLVAAWSGLKGGLWRRSAFWGALLVLAASWSAVTAPKFAARIAAFGTALDYGPNSRYFVSDYSMVWNDNLPTLALGEFLNEVPLSVWVDRFLTSGALPALAAGLDLLRAEHIPYTLCVLIGLCVCVVRRGPLPLLAMLVVWWAGLSIVWQAFPFERHWWGVSALLALACAVGLSEVIKPHRYGSLWGALAATVVLVHGASVALHDAHGLRDTSRFSAVRPVAEYVIAHVEGTVATNKGAWDVMLFDSTATVGGSAQGWYTAERLRTLRTPYTHRLEDMFDDLRMKGATHLMIDGARWREMKQSTPALAQLYEDSDVQRGALTVDFLELLYDSFPQPKLWPIRIYRIRWGRYPWR